jgi:hypothetical protein
MSAACPAMNARLEAALSIKRDRASGGTNVKNELATGGASRSVAV